MAQKKSEGSGITIELRDSAKHKCLTDLKKVATDPEAMCGTGISIIERGVGVEQNCGNAQLFMGVGRPPGSTKKKRKTWLAVRPRALRKGLKSPPTKFPKPTPSLDPNLRPLTQAPRYVRPCYTADRVLLGLASWNLFFD
eukprot:1140378-Pelagomonas_calceolata.AAC.3